MAKRCVLKRQFQDANKVGTVTLCLCARHLHIGFQPPTYRRGMLIWGTYSGCGLSSLREAPKAALR